MIKVYASSVIDANIESVWAYIRDFNELPKWLPLAVDSRIEDDWPADKVGCVRHLRMKDGGTIREQLLSLSDFDYRCVYSILESQTGVDNYVGIIKLTPITDGHRTFAEWSAEFGAPPSEETRIKDFVERDIFQVAFDTLKDHFAHR